MYISGPFLGTCGNKNKDEMFFKTIFHLRALSGGWLSRNLCLSLFAHIAKLESLFGRATEAYMF